MPSTFIAGVTVLALAATTIDLTSLSSFTRDAGTPIFGGTAGNFAGDPHVWEESPGNYRMLYTTDSGSDTQAIGMATSTNLTSWTPIASTQYSDQRVLSGAGPAAGQDHQETAFYYKTVEGQHQIYYIGYDNEGTYHAAIFRATAGSIGGPYTRETTPVIPFGTEDAATMTSPSIVRYGGTLYMSYVGWEAFPSGPVMNMGATSEDDGATWTKTGPQDWGDIFGVEAHIEKGPDGKFYRAAVESDGAGADIISIGKASHPFGPYTKISSVLTIGGSGVGEVDSITSPSLFFRASTSMLYMYYGAVDTGGFPWKTGLATAGPWALE